MASRTLLTWKEPDTNAGENEDKEEVGAGGGLNMELVLDEETLEGLSQIDTKVIYSSEASF